MPMPILGIGINREAHAFHPQKGTCNRLIFIRQLETPIRELAPKILNINLLFVV